jgi:hypothetical protein
MLMVGKFRCSGELRRGAACNKHDQSVTGSWFLQIRYRGGTPQLPASPATGSRLSNARFGDDITCADKTTGLAFASQPSMNSLGLNFDQNSVPMSGRYASNDTMFTSFTVS